MNALHAMLANPLASRLGWSLAHFVWVGAVLAGVLALLLWALRRRSANSRYLASSAVLLMMALAVPVTFLALPPSAPQPVASLNASPDGPPALPDTPNAGMDGTDSSLQADGAQAAGFEFTNVAMSPGDSPAEAASVARSPWHRVALQRLDRAMPWAVLAWLVGVMGLSVRLVAGWLVVQRLKRRFVEPVGEQLQATVERLAQRLAVSRPIRTVKSALAEVPSTLGWIKPVILLPVAALTGLTPDQLEAVIAHELAHIRRYDYLVNLLQSAIETLLFYHPAVWWASQRMRMEREHCCDDLAVAVCGNPVVYARALSRMESLREAPRLMAAATGGSLVMRVRRILGVNAPAGNHFARYTAGLLVAATVLAFFAAVEVSTASGDAIDLAKITESAKNLKDVGTAVGTYAAQHDGTLPTDLSKLAEVGLISPDKLKSPLAPNATTPPYVFVPMGRTKARQADDIVAYEDPAHFNNKGTVVLYPDAHADYVLIAGFTKAISATYARRQLPLPTNIASLCSVHGLAAASAPAAEPEAMRTQPHRWRHFERIVVGKGAITFEGLLTDWEHIGEQMEKGDWRFGSYVGGGYGNNCDPVEERRKLLKHTVLELAKAAEDVPEEAFNQAVGRAAELATKHGYEFLSEIGVHPLGSTGSKSQFLPPLEQRGRWRHFLRYVAMPSGGMGSSATFNGDSAGLKDPRGWFPGLPEPQWTMLELAVAPGTMTPEQYEEAKRDALKLVEKIGLEGMVDLGIRPAEEKASPSVFVPDPKQPGEWTNYVTLVAGPGALTFEGESVTWEQLPARLAAVPDRSNTVFCFAGNQIAARAITPGAKLWSELKQRAHERIAGLGFKHFSNIGWHELGTKGGPSIFTPFTPGVPIRGRRFEGTQGESAPMGAPASAPATNSGKAEDAADSADPLDLFCEELEKVVAKAASRTQQFKATYEACKQLKPEEVTLSASMRQWLEQIPEAEALLAAPASDPALAQARLDEQARLFESGYRNALWQELKLREELARSRSQAAAARDREWQPTSRAAAPERAARLASPTWDLRAQAEGVVKQVLVKAGQIVHQGDVLVTLDDEDIRIELDDARARLEFAQRESALQKQRYQAGLCDEAGYRQAEASAKLAEIDIRRWELRLERTQIKSPCDGYVQIDVRELLGKPVSAGEVLVQIVPRSRPAEKPAANNLPANPSSRPAQGAGIGGPSGVVRLGDGEAAAGATVLLIRPAPEGHAYAAYFVDGKIQNAAGSVVMQTNEAGRFSFAEQQGPFKLVVLDDRGYAETGADNLQPSMVIELKPWGKVEGKLRIGGRVSAGEKIVVQRVDDDPQRMTICHRFETTTDAQGHFVLNRVAPGEAFAGRELEYTRERSNTTFFDHAVPVGVQPGQTAQVTIGGTGRTIVGRVTLPTGHRDFGDTFTVGTLSRPHPGSPPHPENIENMSMAQRLEWWNTWSASAAGKAWMKATSQANMMHTAVMVQADGSFRSEDIPPGNYLLNIRVHELHKGPAWGVGAQIGGASQAITVDNGPADKPVDAGTIQLKAQPSVRAAKSQPAAGTQPSAGIGAKLSYAWLNDPESDPRYLSLTFPDGVFEDARNDAFADTFGAWLEWVAGLKPDPPKLFEHPRLTGDRIQVNVITGRGGKYFGDVLYQFDKNVFYFRGHSTLENRTDTADRCYGPFPADALRSLNLYAPGLHRSASATHAFARNLQVPAGSAYGLRNPPVTRYVLAGQASADVLGFDSEAEWEAAIQQARSPEEATRLRLQHNYAIALEQFGRESPITQRMDADLRAYEAKLAASRPASGTSRD